MWQLKGGKRSITYLLIALTITYFTFSSLYIAWGVFVFLSPLFLFLYQFESKKYAFLVVVVYLYLWGCIANWWLNEAYFGASFLVAFCYLYYSLAFLPLLYIQNKSLGRALCIVVWLSVDYIQLHFTLSIAYAPLGNVLGKLPFLIQWYEYTGVLGGTFWVLVINFAVASLILGYNQRNLLITLAIISFPILLSSVLCTVEIKNNGVMKIATIQPDLKKEDIDQIALLKKFKKSTPEKFLNTSDLILWPENGELLWGHLTELEKSPMTDTVTNFLRNSTSNLLLFGMGVSSPQKGESFNEVYFGETPLNVYSLALGVSNEGLSYWRTKQKYVPCEEFLPNTELYCFVKKCVPQVGSYYSSYLPAKEYNSYEVKGIKLTPLICYEILHGDFVSQFSSEAIVCLQNEVWIEGRHQENQMLYYSACRSIENRKAAVKVSNKGLNSCVNEKGKVVDARREATIYVVSTNNKKTLYSCLGDKTILLLLSLISILASIKQSL